MTRTTKNYKTDGGDTLVIGGKLVIEEAAEIEGEGIVSATDLAALVARVEALEVAAEG